MGSDVDAIDRIIAALIRLVLRGWPTDPESHGAEFTSARVEQLVSETFHAALPAFLQSRNRAFAIGVEESGEPTPPKPHYEPDPDLAAWWGEQSRTLVTLLDSDVPPAVVVQRAAAIVKREATSQVSAAHGEGVRDVAQLRGYKRLLTPERDACVICTSYAGSVTEGGATFDVVRNFTGRELPAEGVEVPIHPNCRCTTRVVYSDEEADARSDALRREAERSILRVEALPSESDRVRMEAAARLLDEGTMLAKTVRERAQRLVNRWQREQAKKRVA